jgi:hypothetical protein
MTFPLPEVTYDLRTRMLVVTASGEYTIDWFIELIGEIARRAVQQQAACILLDVRELNGIVSFVDRYRAGYKAAESWILIPVAVVGTTPFIDPGRLGETVARNRGVNVKVFTDITDAERWLGSFFLKR